MRGEMMWIIAALLLPSLASAHISVICGSSDSTKCGEFTMYFGTYHGLNGLGAAPGKFFMKSASGQQWSGPFNDFKPAATANDGGVIMGHDVAERIHESLNKSFGLLPRDVIHCYKMMSSTPVKTSPYKLYDAAIVPPAEKVDQCYTMQISNWYRALVVNATSGTFETWVTGVDDILRPGPKQGSPCAMSEHVRFAFPVSVCKDGKDCDGFSATKATATVPTSCKQKVMSGFLCPATCPKDSVGELTCDNGKWVDTLQCVDAACSMPQDSDYTGVIGVSGNGCGFRTVPGSPCKPLCGTGYYAPTSDVLTCKGDGKWNVSGTRCQQCPSFPWGVECFATTTTTTSTTTTTTRTSTTTTTTTTSTTTTTTTTSTTSTTTTTSTTSSTTTTSTTTTTTWPPNPCLQVLADANTQGVVQDGFSHGVGTGLVLSFVVALSLMMMGMAAYRWRLNQNQSSRQYASVILVPDAEAAEDALVE